MNILSDLRESMPSGERLYTLLAGVMIFVVLLGYVIFIAGTLIPTLQHRSFVAETFTNAQQEMVNTELTRDDAEELLYQQIEVADTALDQAATNFMNQTQATVTLENIYIYAANNNVTILDLRSLPSDEQEDNIPINSYAFEVDVEGAIPNLLSFLASIKETAHKSFLVDSVNIGQGENETQLTMAITILTSPYAPETSEIATSPEGIEGEGQGEESQTTILPTPIVITHEIMENQLHAIWAEEDWPAAIEILEQLIIMKPGDNETIEKLYAAHVNYGYQFMSVNQPENAQIQFDLALAIKPDGKEAQAGLQASTGTSVQETEPQFTTHVVQAGETLYSISRKYGSKVEAIRLANNLTDNTIHAGNVLTIPLQ
jgi:LysM repeat protein